MDKIVSILQKVSFLRNRYFLVSAFFILWMFFFDQDNFLNRMDVELKVKTLEREREFYQKEVVRLTETRNQLVNNTDAIEKMAREKYMMKKDGEDLYIVTYPK